MSYQYIKYTKPYNVSMGVFISKSINSEIPWLPVEQRLIIPSNNIGGIEV